MKTKSFHIAASCFTLLWLGNFAFGLGVTGLLITLPAVLMLLAHITFAVAAPLRSLRPGGWLFVSAIIFTLLSAVCAWFLAPALRSHTCTAPSVLQCGRDSMMLIGPLAAAGLWLLAVLASALLAREPRS